MRYSENHKQEARALILAAAAQVFKAHGYAGIGVDGLAKRAGVTSGAFYNHFSSKEDAFKEVIRGGVMEVTNSVNALRKEFGDQWAEKFADIYLSDRLFCPLEQSCAIQSISPEIMRSDTSSKLVYENELEILIVAIADGLTKVDLTNRKQRAWAFLATLSGGVTLARSIVDENTKAEIVAGLRQVALQIVNG